jgi:hypothetical protein
MLAGRGPHPFPQGRADSGYCFPIQRIFARYATDAIRAKQLSTHFCAFSL